MTVVRHDLLAAHGASISCSASLRLPWVSSHTTVGRRRPRARRRGVSARRRRRAGKIDTLKRIRDTGTILRSACARRRSPSRFSIRTRRPQGYTVDICLEIADAIKTELKMPRLEVRYIPVSLRQPRRRAAGRQDRPGMRVDHQHARAAEAGRLRLYDLRRRNQDVGQEILADFTASTTCAAGPSS